MFIEVKTNRDETIYINTDTIRSFRKSASNPQWTLLELQYGTEIVTKRPEEIMEMLKGSN